MYLLPTVLMKRAIFRLLYFFFKLIGLIPMRLRDFGFSENTRPHFCVSTLGSIDNVVKVIGFSVIGYYSVMSIFDSDYPNKSATTEKIEIAKASLGVIIVLVLWISIACKQKELVLLANKFVDIDHDLARFKFIDNSQTGAPEFLWLLFINLIIWSTLLITDSVGFDGVPALSYVSSIGPIFVFNWFLFLYTVNMISLRMKCQMINNGLSRLSLKTVSLMEDQSVTSIDKLMVYKFLVLKNMRMVIYEIMIGVGEYYSFPVLLIITELCGSIVYEAYYMSMPVMVPSVPLEPEVVFNSFCYLTILSFPIIIVTLNIGRAQRELNRTPEVIHKFLTRHDLNPKLKSELMLFSMELLHQTIDFSACGIFSLDATLLHSIVSMTVTYLLILIQFHSAESDFSSASPSVPSAS